MSQPDKVTCDELAGIMRPNDNVAVLLILRDGEMQLVTYGRTADDKAEAHEVKEYIVNDLFEGNPPKAKTHESFILDAAKNKQRLDECFELIKRVRTFIENGTQFGYIDQLKPGTPEHKTAADVGWMVNQLQLDRTPAERPREGGE